MGIFKKYDNIEGEGDSVVNEETLVNSLYSDLNNSYTFINGIPYDSRTGKKVSTSKDNSHVHLTEPEDAPKKGKRKKVVKARKSLRQRTEAYVEASLSLGTIGLIASALSLNKWPVIASIISAITGQAIYQKVFANERIDKDWFIKHVGKMSQEEASWVIVFLSGLFNGFGVFDRAKDNIKDFHFSRPNIKFNRKRNDDDNPFEEEYNDYLNGNVEPLFTDGEPSALDKIKNLRRKLKR